MINKWPQRTCLGCGKGDDQTALLRIVIQSGELEVSRLAEGRGGYLHKTETCWDLFLRRKSVVRAFHAEVGRPAKERLIASLRARRWE
ncbi:MAG: YlxR family protein [Candidatus Binatia bacterium]